MRILRHDTLQSLSVVQDGDSLEVGLHCRDGVRVLGLSVVARGGEGRTLWSEELAATPAARVGVPLSEVGARADEDFPAIVRAPRPGAPAVALLDLVVTLEADDDDGTVSVGRGDYRALPIRHSSFTASRPVRVPGGVITPYLRRGGSLSLAYARSEPPVTGSGQVTAVHAGDDAWEVSGVLDTRSHAVTGGELVLVTRRTGDRIVLRTEVTPDVAPDEVAEARRTRFTARVGPEDLMPRLDRPEFLDAVFVADVAHHEQRAEIRVRQVTRRMRLAMPASVLSDGERAGELRAYRTFKSGALAFEFRPLDVAAVDLARTPARSALRLRWQTRKRPVWLVGERPDTAQDTGIALYRYLREEHPEIDARYVISADSPDRAALEGDPGS